MQRYIHAGVQNVIDLKAAFINRTPPQTNQGLNISFFTTQAVHIR